MSLDFTEQVDRKGRRWLDAICLVTGIVYGRTVIKLQRHQPLPINLVASSYVRINNGKHPTMR